MRSVPAIADDGTERIVLKNQTNELNQQNYVATLLRSDDGNAGPLMEKVHCETLGSQNLEKARSTQLNLETFVARYNLVNLWLGNLCHGKSDVLPSPEEAKGWLLGIAGSTLPGNAAQSLGTHRMLVQLYLFGAPGSAPDYPAALALLNEQVKTEPRPPAIYLSYVYEHGLGVPKDQVQARAWLDRAAGAGSPDATMLLAQDKEFRNDAEAFNSYLELSKAVEPPVWFRLGLMYLEGRGTQKDPCKAQEMFQKAASHYWSPVPQARKYLDQIREQKLCIPTVIASLVQVAPTPPLPQSRPPANCPVNLPADTGELHPKRLDQSRKVIHDRAEYYAYMAALGKSDPVQKAAAMEDFVARYPRSVVMTDALEQAQAAYQASGNTAKVAETATRLLQMQPDNLRALAVLVFLARDCATRELAVGKGLSQLAQRGLAALPEWQEAQGASLPDGAKLRDEMAAIFAGAAAWVALQNRDYAAARQFYEKALALNPNNVQDLYQRAIADLEMTPIDPNGFWYCGKAISIAQLQNSKAAAGMTPYCKAKFKWYGGKLEGWDRLVSNTEKETAPSQNFAKSLSLQEPNPALQDAGRTPGVVAPLPPSEKGDPISRLASPAETRAIEAKASGMDVVIAPAEHPAPGTESLSNSEFGSRYGWYVQHVKMTVTANWQMPAVNNAAGRRGQISFEIQPDGSPSNIRIDQSSGIPALDLSLMRAVQRIDRFVPPPTHGKIAVEFMFDSRDKK
jgi:TonB family protein